MLSDQQKKARQKKEKDNKKAVIQADDLIAFRQFAKKTQTDDNDVSSPINRCFPDKLAEFPMQVDADLSRATGSAEVRDDFISKLSRMMQLTGKR